MSSTSSFSADHSASNKPTLASHTDITVINSLSTFFNLQSGQTTVNNLHSQLIDYVFTQHNVVWTTYDVEKVIRAARKTASKIQVEQAADAETERRYEEWEEEVALVATREGKKRKREEKAELYSHYNAMKKRGPHRHAPLALAQLALAHAMVAVGKRGADLRKAEREEQARMREFKRKQAEEAAVEERKQKEKAKAEKDAKAKAEKEKREAEEMQTLKELNANLVRGVAISRVPEWQRKRRQAEEKAEFMKKASLVMDIYLKEHHQNERKEEEKGEEGDEKENQMPS
jgi:hypothetical protein